MIFLYIIKGCGGVTIANGVVEFTAGTNYNAVATVKCNDGYNLDGTGEIVCLDTGIWDLNTANCTIKGKIFLKPSSIKFMCLFKTFLYTDSNKDLK